MPGGSMQEQPSAGTQMPQPNGGLFGLLNAIQSGQFGNTALQSTPQLGGFSGLLSNLFARPAAPAASPPIGSITPATATAGVPTAQQQLPAPQTFGAPNGGLLGMLSGMNMFGS